MADIRIKDLTTEVSSTATGDFFVIDGTTGTRKTPAFNPTFGGNATVGGTLTVNGAAYGIVANGAGISLNTDYSASVRFFDGATVKWWIYKLSSDENLYFRDMGNGRMQLQMLPGATSSTAISTFNSRLEVTSTTASTTTSSGALVVGNGTSGGLGVGGNINGGGYLRSINSSAANGSAFDAFRADIGADGTLGALEVKAGGLPSATAGSRYGYILAGDAGAFRKFYVGGTASGGAQVLIPATDISTSTSSGALVVSGGVGVAKELYLGIKLNISTHTGDAGGIGFGTETNLYRYQAGGLALDHASGTAPALLFRETGTSTLRLETNSGVGYLSTLTSANLIFRTNSTVALTLDTSQNAIFAGTVRTAAPSGGTAASWKLGSVATVSPTSPNRTIEVDIGGTIYYIHAKTTNN